MKGKIAHPEWATQHRKPGTELKYIHGRYYLYGVKSQYDSVSKKAKKLSLGIIGSITQDDGLVLSPKAEMKKNINSGLSAISTVYSKEYGFSFWMNKYIKNSIQPQLERAFPNHFKLILLMVYCRIAYQSPIKNIPFHLSGSCLNEMLDAPIPTEKSISQGLREFGIMRTAMVTYMKAFVKPEDCILVDATDIACHSSKVSLAAKGYNSKMDFELQFTLLYVYSATNHSPYFFRLLPGNIREVSALKNTLEEAGITDTTFIADKGFYSENNINALEDKRLKYIIPLRRNNKQINYELLKDIDLKPTYFKYLKGFIFYQSYQNENKNNSTINMYYDGKMKEQEKQDYLARIQTLPEKFTTDKYKSNLLSMGTISMLHNLENQSPEEIYLTYKSRAEIEQFFDCYKNTLSATATYMQNDDALQGWVFVNHIAMQIVYQIFLDLKTNKLNKKHSIADFVMHLANIKRTTINNEKNIVSEINATTKNILKALKISIT